MRRILSIKIGLSDGIGSMLAVWVVCLLLLRQQVVSDDTLFSFLYIDSVSRPSLLIIYKTAPHQFLDTLLLSLDFNRPNLVQFQIVTLLSRLSDTLALLKSPSGT